jgi:hypothetical protein
MEQNQIRQMPAGREMDKLIAEQVMGISMYHYDKGHPDNCYFMLLDADGDPVLFAPRFRDAERKTEAEAWQDCPCYSTDIAAAWQVVEKLTADGWGHKHHVYSKYAEMPGWQWTFMQSGKGPNSISGAEAETAPLAICRAALLAIASPAAGQEGGAGE